MRGDSEQVDVTLHWAGGVESRHRLIRPVQRYEQLSTYPLLMARIETLHHEGLSFARIAGRLTAEGFYPPKRTDRFTGEMIARLRRRSARQGPGPRARVEADVLKPHEYWLSDLARELTMPKATLYEWQRWGWVHSRKVAEASGRLALWADADELGRLRRLRAYQRQWPEPGYPQALIQLKERGSDGDRRFGVDK